MISLRALTALGALGFLSACATVPPSVTPPLFEGTSIEYTKNWDVANLKGTPFLAYYDAQGNVKARQAGQEAVLSLAETAPSGLVLAQTPDDMLLAWREKQPRKLILQSTKASAPLFIEAAETDPLARMEIGRVLDEDYLVWLGERAIPNEKSIYHLYFWSTKHPQINRLIQGIDFKTASTEEGHIGLLVSGGDDKNRLSFVSRAPGAADFSAPVTIDDSSLYFGPLLTLTHTQGRWVAVWEYLDGDANKGVVRVAHSVDGQTWTHQSFDLPERYEAVSIDFKDLGGTELGILISAVNRNKAQGTNGRTYFLHSTNSGATWSGLSDLRPVHAIRSIANRAHLVREQKTERLWAVWEDWASAMPQVHGRYSEDNGRTWSESTYQMAPHLDAALTLPYPRSGKPLVDFDGLVLQKAENLNITRFTVLPFAPYPQPLSLETDPKEAEKVRAAATVFWAKMKERVWPDIYKAFDPLMREAWPYETFLQRRGMIQYGDAEIAEIKTDGNIALVRVKVHAKVDDTRARNGDIIKGGEKDLDFVERWIKIQGQWYKEYREQAAEIQFTRYDKW
jgi:hypothetical protein